MRLNVEKTNLSFLEIVANVRGGEGRYHERKLFRVENRHITVQNLNQMLKTL